MNSNHFGIEKSIEYLNRNYTPTITPIYADYLGKIKSYDNIIKSTKIEHIEVVDALNSDVIAKRVNPQQTDINTVKTRLSSKQVIMDFFMLQYKRSFYQNNFGVEDALNEIKDKNNMHLDSMFFLGEQSSSGEQINNGLWNSIDSDFDEQASTNIPQNFTINDVKEKLDNLLKISEENSGNAKKIVYFIGGLANKLGYYMPNLAITFKQALIQTYKEEGKDVDFKILPSYILKDLNSDLDDTNKSGILITNPSKITIHFASFPEVVNAGENTEGNYNFYQIGYSSLVPVLECKGAVVKQRISVA